MKIYIERKHFLVFISSDDAEHLSIVSMWLLFILKKWIKNTIFTQSYINKNEFMIADTLFKNTISLITVDVSGTFTHKIALI